MKHFLAIPIVYATSINRTLETKPNLPEEAKAPEVVPVTTGNSDVDLELQSGGGSGCFGRNFFGK